MIRADRVQVGDVLVPVVEYGKVIDVRHGVNNIGGYVRMQFDDGKVTYCPPDTTFRNIGATTMSTQNRFQRITVDGVKYVSDISDARVYEIGQGDDWYEVFDEKTVARVRDKLKKRAISNAR